MLDWLAPIGWATALLSRDSVASVGVILIAAGLSLDAAAMITMHRARTNILPHRAADKLLTSGVFALTRNPIYVGNTLLLLGIGLFTATAWLLLSAFVAAVAVDRLAIRREETHLAARFGDAYRAYLQTTPRWLGVPGKASPAAP